jgi:hypothetical protein
LFDTIADRRTVVHELALEGHEALHVGDHVALVNDGVSIAAVVTAIDDRLHPPRAALIRRERSLRRSPGGGQVALRA